MKSGIEVEAGSALQAGQIDSSPGTQGVGGGAHQQAVAEAGDGNDPTVDEFVEDDVRLVRPAHGRAGRSGVRGRNRIEPGIADECGHRDGFQQAAAVGIDSKVLPRHLRDLFAVDARIHVRPAAVGDACLARRETRSGVAVERVHDRLRLGLGGGDQQA